MSDQQNPSATNQLSAELLPRLFRTDTNKKFLQATVDQLIQPGTAKRVNGYIGRKNSKATKRDDIFIEAVNSERQNYQLEPGFVIKDNLNNTLFFKDYMDYINQISVFGGNKLNHARINDQEYYSWDPHINWDKFANFRDYYWVSTGPEPIKVYGQQEKIVSEYSVVLTPEVDNNTYVFTPDSFTKNPVVTLYRGQTYKFNISSTNHPFSIKTSRSLGKNDLYLTGVSINSVENGVIEFTVPYNAPNVLYYQSESDIDLGGVFHVLSINENSVLNIELDILGKKTYTLPSGVSLSNGMKVQFVGNVTPSSYLVGYYYVEGVGSAIQLIKESDIEFASLFPTSELVTFDYATFDEYPFGEATLFAEQPDYITINRASGDRNQWSRYNRWVHKDVIKVSAELNGLVPSFDQAMNATRPIIEFNANLKLFNSGIRSIGSVNYIDSTITDVFSTIEGSQSYTIQGKTLLKGDKIIFSADTDPLVKNNIYEVDIVSYDSVKHIHLVKVTEPLLNDTVLVKDGLVSSDQGKVYWYNGTSWIKGQQKIAINQCPLFDVVDDNGVSFGDYSVYFGTSFAGTKLFSYKVGTGNSDSVLGFPLTYKNIDNIGDIVFSFNLASDTFEYKDKSQSFTKSLSIGYLVYNDSLGTQYLNGWQKNAGVKQPAVRIFKDTTQVNNFKLDIFDDVSDLDDLVIKVYKNGKRVSESEWNVVTDADFKTVVFNTDVLETDVITLKAIASQPINNNGYYEPPVSLQNNPLNDSMSDFTLGEVTDHVASIVDNIPNYFDNLRDVGNSTSYGTKFVQHSCPASLSVFHMTSDSTNVIKSLEFAREEYNKFKRNFIIAADLLGVDATPRVQVDAILQTLNKDKNKTFPYYFSDMVPFGASIKTDITVVDYRVKTYPLTNVFTLDTLSDKAVGVYVNDVQLVHGIDYTFDTQGFVIINSTIVNGDVISIVEYESTDGSFVPETPTKLGMWPLFVPKIINDTSYVTPRTMIQGHDGSLVLAYGDYRDDLILELEKRIYNNVKVAYNEDIFNISDMIPGYNRQTEYSLDEFNEVISSGFYKWATLIDRDFTKPLSFDRNNSLTYNYSGYKAIDGRSVPGYWRGIYRWMLDTDKPNVSPWEMLGFSIEPVWWQDVYGPAPYTSDNLVMWNDIANGYVKEPGKALVVRQKFAKPFLLNCIPVDEQGNVVSPLESGLVTGTIIPAPTSYVFGDCSPIENAWRRSSHYPFSVISALTLMYPSKVIGTLFDRSRIIRNKTNQLVYADTNLRITLSSIKLPNTYESQNRVYTAGLVNYVVNFVIGSNLDKYNQYQYNLKNLTCKLSYRLGAFTSKEKFNLLLDSKSPSAAGNIFIPADDYDIVLNTSSPTKKVIYSGVIVTKLVDKYEVKGYSKTQPYFRYYNWIGSGKTVNVGGISEGYLVWASGQQYTVGKNVKYNNKFYKTKVAHVSSNEFDFSKFEYLPTLPVVGGRSAVFRNKWDKTSENVIPYGKQFDTIQDVIDFILGYGEWLSDQGFVFDNFNKTLSSVMNWETSAKEFLFWTTQNWTSNEDNWNEWKEYTAVEFGSIVRYNGDYYKAIMNVQPEAVFNESKYVKLDGLSSVGSPVISLSPAANGIVFSTGQNVVDSITNPFNDYEIFKVDGTPIKPNFINSYREDNLVGYRPDRNDEIYGASFYLVQKEHVVVLNNSTIFNDTIYTLSSGYRQDRVKVIGYTSTNWNGAFNAPGFVFDQANIREWTQWTDYSLGDIVKLREFYYSAKSFVAGSETFDATNWIKLDSKPAPKLLPNWTYKASQFEDFYSLDSNNFDSEQQRLAQHITGYQKRQYLTNIIKDDVSEFKFYQGMISEKGTTNSLKKLFDVLSASSSNSLSFYEEWAIRVGRYGASSAFDSIELLLDESKFKSNPQGFELVDSTADISDTDFIIRKPPSQVYVKPSNYNSEPWPVLNTNQFLLRSAGYIRPTDVDLIVTSLSEITYSDVATLVDGSYVWCTFEGATWNVYRHTFIDNNVVDVELNNGVLTVYFKEQLLLSAGEYVTIAQTETLNGYYRVISSSNNAIELVASQLQFNGPFTEQDTMLVGKFISWRASSIDDIDAIIRYPLKTNEYIWTDLDETSHWAAWKNQEVYADKSYLLAPRTPSNGLDFGKALGVNASNTLVAVSNSTGTIEILGRSTSNLNWSYIQTLSVPFIEHGSLNDVSLIATTIAVSPDSNWIAVGSPHAGNAAYTGTPTLGNSLVYTDQNEVNSIITDHGVVSLYKRSEYNIYELVGTFISPEIEQGELFGQSLVFTETALYVGAPGNTTNKGKVYSIDYVLEKYNTWVASEDNTELFGSDLSVSDDYTTLVISAPGINNSGSVFVYKKVVDFSLLYNITGSIVNFGKSIDVSSDGIYVIVSSIYADDEFKDQGEVYVYKLNGATYTLYQTLTNVQPELYGFFGYKIQFGESDNSIVVFSRYADTFDTITFDNLSTSFDKNTTRFGKKSNNSGRIDVYDRYNNKWIFGESLQVDSNQVNGYGKSIIAIDNKIYVSSEFGVIGQYTSGSIAEYEKPRNKFSWSKFRQQIDTPDLSKLKRVFLYNTETSEMLDYIDSIDPVQGKIAGVADQEIKFKTFYDPASYSVGTDEVVVDSLSSWGKDQVGTLWWDLRTAKFINSYDNDVLYRTRSWNTLATGASIDVYEWVESQYIPSGWNSLADTEEGLSIGISGTAVYGDSVYSVVRKYDKVSGRFKNIYYFWVKDKKTVPNVTSRTLSSYSIAQLIENPRGQGYRYITFTGSNSFSLVNVNNLLVDNVVALGVEFWNNGNLQNIHSEWKLISNNEKTVIPQFIEQKWIDSLCGKDVQGRMVPDTSLPAKLRYGIENRPNQSMFINRIEALKQLVEHANEVLMANQISEIRDVSLLNSYDPEPSTISGIYDSVVDTESDIQYVDTQFFIKAQLTAIITDGRITGANIVEAGNGYVNAPYVTIIGNGTAAVMKCIINSNGQVTGVNVINSGEGYSSATLFVRGYSVLVRNDTSLDCWSVYSQEPLTSAWSRVLVQTYDTRKYWEYVDWYSNGFNQYTFIDKVVDYYSELNKTESNIGDIIKVRYAATNKWVLLEKHSDVQTDDLTQVYNVVGIQNGTIQLKDILYRYANTVIGYDGHLYDDGFFDNSASTEMRSILVALKDSIFIDDLRVHYLNLFFNSIRYVLSEQLYVDWIFKTSFVKSIYNANELSQPVNYQDDILDDFKSYVNEVKPYRTKVREYISSYNKLEEGSTSVTDFDFAPIYRNGQYVATDTTINENGVIVSTDSEINDYPRKHWLDNVGFELTEIVLVDTGINYVTAPEVRITSPSGSGASAVAYISNGKVKSVVLLTKGKYLLTPTVELVGGQGINNVAWVANKAYNIDSVVSVNNVMYRCTLAHTSSSDFQQDIRYWVTANAKAVAILSNSVVRAIKAGIKFDRVDSSYVMSQLTQTDTFVGDGVTKKFELTWPPDTNIGNSTVLVDGSFIIRSDYTLSIESTNEDGYTAYYGSITFLNAVANGATISVEYNKNSSMLSATDRIQYFYNPTINMPGKDLGQLMNGINYDGVKVTGYDFDASIDFDTQLGGGNFEYTTATGLLPEDINVNGDDFVTSYTSHAPEEIVPGQLVDSLMIKVFDQGTDGAENIAYCQFKDMLNRHHFKRLSLNKRATLVSDLLPEDTEIVVSIDAATFDEPAPHHNIPGVVEIRGERIEYFTKTLVGSNYELGQLRRGTLGTGIPTVHKSGAYVQDIGTSETIPYKNTIIVDQSISTGSNIVNLSFRPLKFAQGWLLLPGFVTSIPAGYGQSDNIDVYVGGYIDSEWTSNTSYVIGNIVRFNNYTYRCVANHTSTTVFDNDRLNWKLFIGNIKLIKKPYVVSDVTVSPVERKAAVQMDLEFSVDGENNEVRLTTPVESGLTITVVAKKGQDWSKSVQIRNGASSTIAEISEFLNSQVGVEYAPIYQA